ncbi:hypothetical protein Tco_0493782 [Tanacetum coccineum]
MMSRMDNEVGIRIYGNSQEVEDVIEGKHGSRDSVKKRPIEQKRRCKYWVRVKQKVILTREPTKKELFRASFSNEGIIQTVEAANAYIPHSTSLSC